jgi:hypothetical protein
VRCRATFPLSIVIGSGAATRASRFGPARSPPRVEMPPQQPPKRRWERFRSAIPSPRSMAGPQRRLQAIGVAHPQQSGRSRPFCVGDWDAGATRTGRRDRREPRCGAGRQVPTGRRQRTLPTQSVLKPQPYRRAARTPRRISPRTRDGRALVRTSIMLRSGS